MGNSWHEKGKQYFSGMKKKIVPSKPMLLSNMEIRLMIKILCCNLVFVDEFTGKVSNATFVFLSIICETSF
mgnify:CR=1 FL=1